MTRTACSICGTGDNLAGTNCYVCEKPQCALHSIMLYEGVDRREVSLLRGYFCPAHLIVQDAPDRDLYCIVNSRMYEIGQLQADGVLD